MSKGTMIMYAQGPLLPLFGIIHQLWQECSPEARRDNDNNNIFN
jgi:hypothetical protein